MCFPVLRLTRIVLKQRHHGELIWILLNDIGILIRPVWSGKGCVLPRFVQESGLKGIVGRSFPNRLSKRVFKKIVVIITRMAEKKTVLFYKVQKEINRIDKKTVDKPNGMVYY